MFKCSKVDCGRTFAKRSRLKWHETTHAAERHFACTVNSCGKTYKRASHLYRHEKSCHAKLFGCKEKGCHKEFASVDSLTKHMDIAHSFEKCKSVASAQDISSSSSSVKSHLSEHASSSRYRCDEEGCSKVFGQLSHLKRHSRQHLGYDCPVAGCSERFTSWQLVRKHKAMAHKPVLRCSACSKQCSTPALLRRHANIVHPAEGLVVLHKCRVGDCDKAYPDARNLAQHVRVVHEKLRFHCTAASCKKSFTTKQKLGLHLLTHESGYTTPAKKVRTNVHRRKSTAAKLTELPARGARTLSGEDTETTTGVEVTVCTSDAMCSDRTECDASRSDTDLSDTLSSDKLASDIHRSDTDLSDVASDEVGFSSAVEMVDIVNSGAEKGEGDEISSDDGEMGNAGRENHGNAASCEVWTSESSNEREHQESSRETLERFVGETNRSSVQLHYSRTSVS